MVGVGVALDETPEELIETTVRTLRFVLEEKGWTDDSVTGTSTPSSSTAPPSRARCDCPLILDELADEQRWSESFARSQEQLARVAAKLREDIRAGRVQSGGIDQL